jgi:hypothetical protein
MPGAGINRLEKMVGVARIELATPAMSTRAAPTNLLIFRASNKAENPICPTKNAIRQCFEFTLNQSNTVGAALT